MITKDVKISEVMYLNPRARQIFLSFRIGGGVVGFNEEQTVEEACIEHGVNMELLLRELNFNKMY